MYNEKVHQSHRGETILLILSFYCMSRERERKEREEHDEREKEKKRKNKSNSNDKILVLLLRLQTYPNQSEERQSGKRKKRRTPRTKDMGACTSKVKKNKEKYLHNDSSTKNKKNPSSAIEQSSSINIDKFANVPFIDSEEKLTTTPPSVSPTNDNDEQTTVKNNFETNVSYSNVETIAKLKQEVATFLREKILPDVDEKHQLLDYVHKRIIGKAEEKKILDQYLEQCFDDIEQNRSIDPDNPIKKRLMNIVTIYVASQSSDNSFLKALYDKLGSALDLNSLNAETNEHEVVNVTITKRVRQVYLDDPSNSIINENSHPKNTVIHISNNQQNIPDDLPDDIRRKAEQVLNSFNDVLHAKQ